MQPRIEILPEKKLIGLSIEMTLTNNKTKELWMGFGPRKAEIQNRVDTNSYSLQQYDGANTPFLHGLTNSFTKWALVEVTSHDRIPDGMHAYTLPAGKYAVFKYKGTPMTAMPFITDMFNKWIPEAGYEIDNRPHFEILPEGYNPMNPEAEEEFWIPVTRASL